MAKREKGNFWVYLAAVIFYPATWLFARVRSRGGPNIPTTGGALVVFNHVSYIDPMYDAVFLHRNTRVPRFLAKDSLWRVPVLGRILRGADQIPVVRGTADAQRSLAAGVEALAEGKAIVIYPEGTITRDPDHWPMRSRTGVARLALSSDVPVIPVARDGSQELYDHYRRRFRPLPRKRVDYLAGPPVDLSAYRGRPLDAALLREVTDLIMGAVRDNLAELRGTPAPSAFHRTDRPGPDTGADT